MTKPILLAGIVLLAASWVPALGQLQATYPWPVTPFNESQRISGTFGEFRGPDNPHFHNGTDIPKPDGSPVYPVADGRVVTISPIGSNAYVRVDNYAYVHIQPSPTLSVGDQVVAGQTILGTILPGQGHVHLNDGYPGSYLNAIRPEGGLTPFVDPWPPDISGISFFLQETGQVLDKDALTGTVKIIFRVMERTAPPETSGSGLNNGGYRLGYRILSADRSSEIYAPSADGEVFLFASIPGDHLVGNVFDLSRSSTSEHVYIITNAVDAEKGWDTSTLADGDYSVMVFAEDTRGNRTEAFITVSVTQRDLVPPPAPYLHSVVAASGMTELGWSGESVPDLAGFRLYASPDFYTWLVYRDESSLGPLAIQSSTRPGAPEYYYMTAVDSAVPANESEGSDRYGAWPGQPRTVLIVDGFDRFGGSGSWSNPAHPFAIYYGQALASSGVGFSTVSNEQVSSGMVTLADYDGVIWFLGDESTGDETFSRTEQLLVQAYLEGGGKLFVSGSEVAWDLGARGSAADQDFLSQYLKVTYAGDDSDSYRVEGTPGSIMDGLDRFTYGALSYPEDFPDYFLPASGGSASLVYANGRVAGVQYNGVFGTGTVEGKVFVMGFPLETIWRSEDRNGLMQRVLAFFFPEITGNESVSNPQSFDVGAAYPNPANEVISIPYSISTASSVEIIVTDVLGRQVFRSPLSNVSAGDHNATINVLSLTSGVYFARVIAESGSSVTKFVVAR